MFERFTPDARNAIVHAQQEARLLTHNYIGTEHLLLGLLHDVDGIAGRTLLATTITLEAAREQIAEICAPGRDPLVGHIPFTPRAKRVLEFSVRAALELGDNFIGTEHVLLGLLRDGEGVAAQLLAGPYGADSTHLRAAVLAMRDGGPPPRTASRHPGRTAGTAEVMAAARHLAGDQPLATHHLLSALAQVTDTTAAQILDTLGITTEMLTTAIASAETSDTRDAFTSD